MDVIDLFAGCGGLTAGLRQLTAGDGQPLYKPVLAVDLDEVALSTYAANFGDDHAVCEDIAEVSAHRVPSADVVVGGPPCQGFSSIGKRDDADVRNLLWRHYVRLVKAADPDVFVMENVGRFSLTPEFGLMTSYLNEEFRDYNWDWKVVNAVDFGVPQNRKRTIIVASRVSRVSFDDLGELAQEDIGVPKVSNLREAFRGLDWEIPRGHVLPEREGEWLNGIIVAGEFTEQEIHLPGVLYPRQKSLDRYRAIGPGQGRFDLPDELQMDCWRRKKSGTTDVMGRLEWDEPSVTVRAEFHKAEKGRYLHPQFVRGKDSETALRTISLAEGARIQTFPIDFVWCGRRDDIARQIGNAVPATLAAYLGRWVQAMVEGDLSVAQPSLINA
jgi:DNA (cytosine-5)-methyltransferase 1